MIKKVIETIVLIIGIFLLGCFVGRRSTPKDALSTQMDTLVVHDTVVHESPVEIRRIKTTDTLIVPIIDTLRVRDTVYLVLNRQIKEYRDSLYYARVSGYDPCLDYIEVYPKSTTISKIETVIIEPSTIRCGLDVGLDYGGMGNRFIMPNIGAGIDYKKTSVHAEIGFNVGLDQGTFMTPQIYWKVGLKYRLLSN